MEKIKLFSLFSGIGAYETALKNIGIDFELMGYSEIDRYASKSYSLIHNTTEVLNFGDITKINEKELPDFDLLVGSSPCQSFSNVCLNGKEGLKSEKGNLFFNFTNILNHCKPKYFLFENVKDVLTINKGKDWEQMKPLLEMNYNIKFTIMNSKYFNVSQNRQRLYVVGIRKDIDENYEFPLEDKDKQVPVLKDFIELGQELTYDYYLTESNLNSYLNKQGDFGKRFKVKNIDEDYGYCLTTKSCKAVVTNNYIQDIHGIRGLTEREYCKLQGFDPDIVQLLKSNRISKNQIYRMIGNSITVPVLEEIFKNLFNK